MRCFSSIALIPQLFVEHRNWMELWSKWMPIVPFGVSGTADANCFVHRAAAACRTMNRTRVREAYRILKLLVEDPRCV